MYRARNSAGPLWVAAGTGMLFWWLIKPDPAPDEELVSLVGRLTALQSTSTVLASAIVAGASIVAAVAIPLVTVWALRQTEQPMDPREPRPTTPALDTGSERPQLPAGTTPVALPERGAPDRRAPLQIESEKPTTTRRRP